MGKNVRLNFTENEKIANSMYDGSYDNINFNNAKNIEEIITEEKKRKFNDEVDKRAQELEEQKKQIEKYQEDLQDSIDKVEIKPLFNRVLVKPFACNPFQRISIDNGIITDIGGMNPNIQFNQITGQYEERDQQIVVATVVEVGPECKYIQVGDTVFYLRHLPTPVPFFKQGFWTLKEDNIIAVVNEGLSERFSHVE